MSFKKYRLAAPINNNEINVSRIPKVSFNVPLLSTSNDGKLNSKSIKLNLSTSNDDKLNSTSIKLNDKEKGPRWWIVLPCLLLIFLTTSSDVLLINDLIVRRYERYYGLSTSVDAQRTACRQSATTTPAPFMRRFYWQFPPFPPRQNPSQQSADYDLVQRDTANFNVKSSFATLIPALVTFIILGSNCDTIGRRPLLVLPFLGKVIRYTLMIIIVARDLSDAWLIATYAIEAIFGSSGLALLSAFSFITDCTDKTRTHAFFLTEIMLVIARIIPVLAIGLWLRHHFYIGPLSVDLGLSIIGLFYALFIQPESVESVKNLSFILQLFRVRLKPIIRVITVFTKKRSGHRRQRLFLITIVTILVLFILYGYTSVFTLYLYGHPFCFDALNVALISLAQALTVSIVSLLIVLSKRTFDKTYILPFLGSIALIIGLIMFSFVKKLWLLYIAACIGSLFFISLPVLRTKLTKLVEINEYAIVFIAAGILETVGNNAVGVIANDIYKSSVKFFPGLVFLVFAIVGVFPLIIMGYLTYSESRENKNTNRK